MLVKRLPGLNGIWPLILTVFPPAIHVTRANVSDRDGASAMIVLHAHHLWQAQNVLVDGGYSGELTLG